MLPVISGPRLVRHRVHRQDGENVEAVVERAHQDAPDVLQQDHQRYIEGI